MFNCNQNNHSYQKSIKYYLWLERQQTNNISIAISFGFQNFSEQSPLLNFSKKKSKILQILQLAICQLICNMHD
jgi:hypothetical protein